MDLFDYCNYKSDSFPDSAPPPQVLGSSGPHGRWLEEDDEDAINNITLISVKSSPHFTKLGKIMKKLFKMVVNVEKLLKMVEK